MIVRQAPEGATLSHRALRACLTFPRLSSLSTREEGAQPTSHLPHAGVVMQAKFTRLAAATATHMRLARFAPLVVLAVMWSLPAEVDAQRRTVNGVVRDSAGAPIPEADVSIPSAHLLARTDNSGAFALTRVEPGQLELTVRRLGYVPQSLQIDVRPNNSDTLVVVLTAQAFELQGVAVNEQVKRHLLWIEDFYRRRAKGIGGTFYTR